ncbi:hypothetical protein HMI54_007911 [Coelomomyces lativittatus]|nr:hypothetical protein HMI54_007911 [Coelomomyces lativittatus]
MEKIDRHRLYTDISYRFSYVTSFVGFNDDDKKAIKDSAPHLAPLVPTVVDAVYNKLFTYDITKMVFIQRMEGYTGESATEANLADS